MPRSLIVRKLDEELVAKLKRRAAANGRSAEAEHREILRTVLADESEASPAGGDQHSAGRRLGRSQQLRREGLDER